LSGKWPGRTGIGVGEADGGGGGSGFSVLKAGITGDNFCGEYEGKTGASSVLVEVDGEEAGNLEFGGTIKSGARLNDLKRKRISNKHPDIYHTLDGTRTYSERELSSSGARRVVGGQKAAVRVERFRGT